MTERLNKLNFYDIDELMPYILKLILKRNSDSNGYLIEELELNHVKEDIYNITVWGYVDNNVGVLVDDQFSFNIKYPSSAKKHYQNMTDNYDHFYHYVKGVSYGLYGNGEKFYWDKVDRTQFYLVNLPENLNKEDIMKLEQFKKLSGEGVEYIQLGIVANLTASALSTNNKLKLETIQNYLLQFTKSDLHEVLKTNNYKHTSLKLGEKIYPAYKKDLGNGSSSYYNVLGIYNFNGENLTGFFEFFDLVKFDKIEKLSEVLSDFDESKKKILVDNYLGIYQRNKEVKPYSALDLDNKKGFSVKDKFTKFINKVKNNKTAVDISDVKELSNYFMKQMKKLKKNYNGFIITDFSVEELSDNKLCIYANGFGDKKDGSIQEESVFVHLQQDYELSDIVESFDKVVNRATYCIYEDSSEFSFTKVDRSKFYICKVPKGFDISKLEQLPQFSQGITKSWIENREDLFHKYLERDIKTKDKNKIDKLNYFTYEFSNCDLKEYLKNNGYSLYVITINGVRIPVMSNTSEGNSRLKMFYTVNRLYIFDYDKCVANYDFYEMNKEERFEALLKFLPKNSDDTQTKRIAYNYLGMYMKNMEVKKYKDI